MLIKTQKEFTKNFSKLRLNRNELSNFLSCMISLVRDEILPDYARDHALSGRLKGYKEFHLSGDKVVVYKTDEKAVQLVNIGSHTQVFRGM